MGTVYGRQARYHVYPKDHLPIHANARVGSGEVIVEIRDGTAILSTHHRNPIVGWVTRRAVESVLEEATELSELIVALWEKMHE